MHLSSPIYFLCFSEFANSFEHIIKTIQRMYYSEVIITTKVALQEGSFDWLME